MTKQKHRAQRQSNTESMGITLLLGALKTLAVTLIFASLFVLGAAAVASSMPDPIRAVSAAAWISLALSSVCGGIASYLVMRECAQTLALISGGMLSCVLLIFALASGSADSPIYMLVGYGAVVLIHFLSAKAAAKLFGTKKRKRRTY